MAQHRFEIADRIANLMKGGKEAALNARTSLQGVEMGSLGTVDFSLWGKNLGDEEYVIQGVDFGALGFAQQAFGAPLTAGLEVAFRY